MSKAGKPKGAKSAYIFFQQACREEHDRKHPGEKVEFAEFSKNCAAQWKTLSESKKQRFNQMAVQDKIRRDQEMKDYVPQEDERKRKGKAVKDPNAPKKPLTAYFLYMRDYRPKLVTAHPELKLTEVSSELGKQWREASTDIRQKYETMAKQEKAKYEKVRDAYANQNQNGHGSSTSAKRNKVQVQQEVEASDSDDDDESEESD